MHFSEIGERGQAIDTLRHSSPRAGGCRVLAIEGRSGAGKSILADRLAAELDCPIIHVEDLYPGWNGLAASIPLIHDWVFAPLYNGENPRWRRYDWERGEHAEWHETRVDNTVLIEGCGCGATELRPHLSALVWVDTPKPERERRLARRWDATLYAPYRAVWARQEETFYATHRPYEHADVIIDNAAPLSET